ncbi:MAG: 3-phosphoshikimate 1-carboxyvinyltransferase [Deltaproteobacteria bacterium HGW-Deltaproteobacteria-8]|jgi:3-phosphoshikimate 1-carboxyvinyltransferase|nr:MAG: 3-phosphoshikimate 1-carboxyvinyltransferase [Deltaproteobacteria bacterium HGW-Deltaproteobacteria-8]
MSATSAHVLIQAPASKSMSHRALIGAALAPGESRLSGVLESQDTTHTMGCLAACGARFARLNGGEYLVQGMRHGPASGESVADLDVGESGTTCRLLAGVVAGGRGRFRIHGAPRMHERPLGEPARALASQGVVFHWEEKPGYPPVVIETPSKTGLPGGEIDVRLEDSSQYLSGILLAAPLAKTALTIAISGTKAVSWPYVSLTLQTMRDFGVPVVVETLVDGRFAPVEHESVTRAEPGKLRFIVQPGLYQPRSLCVEGDWSNASYFLAAGAVGSRPVTVRGLSRDSLQGDRAILDILAAMGARIAWTSGSHSHESGKDGGDEVTVLAPLNGQLRGALHGVDVDMGACPDLVPTVAVAACFAKGPTTIRNVAHLRIKECDRLETLATEIAKTGCLASMTHDTLTITPAPLPKGKRILFESRGDHRMVMGPALFGLGGIDAQFDNPGCVAKSFPEFWDRFAAVLAGAGQA